MTSTAAATTPPTSCSSRRPSGAWQATTKVTLPVTANYQQAGLIVYGDDDNYAKLDLLYDGGRRVRVHPGDRRDAAQRGRRQRPPHPAGDTVYLRLTSDGTNLTAALLGRRRRPSPRSAGRPRWPASPTRRSGVFALNGGTTAPVVDAAFDWFQVTPDAPAEPVDPSDEFAGATLDKCRWDAIVREDPAAYRVADGALQIDVPNGDIYGTRQHRADELHPAERAVRRLDPGDEGRRQPARTSSTSRPVCSCTPTTTTT